MSYYDQDFAHTDFRQHPERYKVGKGEQGVLMVEPYKSEILPLWRFRTPAVARTSARAIYKKFLAYKAARDFVGMDMARKFLQMGFTRARRYANHPSGRKYEGPNKKELPRGHDPEKARAAAIFYEFYVKAREDEDYKTWRAAHTSSH